MATDKLEGSALEIFPINEAYSWKALPFNDLRGTTDSNIPESRTIRLLHSEKKETPVMRKRIVENFGRKVSQQEICIATNEPIGYYVVIIRWKKIIYHSSCISGFISKQLPLIV